MSDITKIITVILGIAVLTLIINRASDSVSLIQAASSGFNSILKTITLQGN
jgi:hypothetical protein